MRGACRRVEQAGSELQELQNGTRPEQINAQQAVVKQFDARLADLDVTLAKSTLNAPFGGTVSEHKIDTGTVVNAGQSVIRLVESGSAQARIGLPVTAVAKLDVGEEIPSISIASNIRRQLTLFCQKWTGKPALKRS